jgi:hypothetical protein
MPNLALLAIVLIAGYAAIESSARSNEKKFQERRAAQANPPEHEMVGNQALGWAWFVALLIAIVGIYAAMPR